MIVMEGTTIGLVDKVFESVNGSAGIALYTKVKKNKLRCKMLYLVCYLPLVPLHIVSVHHATILKRLKFFL